MSTIRPLADGAVTAPHGFQAAGVACGLKPTGAADLALIYSSAPCVAAAMFTANLFQAAPVIYDRALLAGNASHVRAVAINSGCANACTGAQGLADAQATAAAVATQLGLAADEVMVMSTGVIGQPLPMAKILAGVADAATALKPGLAAGHAAARAIMTTDTRPKECAVEVSAPAGEFTVGGMVKGAGMIHPNLATMLCLLTSDVQITPELADRALRRAVECSFHRITIDGDTSTNDTVLLLANGAADAAVPITSADSAEYTAFVAGLTHVAADLARAMVRDGEGATRFIEITVRGARDDAEARQVGMSVARSQLVKTAIYGQDANWGRIICAVGYSGAAFDPDRVGVWLGDLELVRAGAPFHIDEARAAEILAQPDVPVAIDLGQGEAELTVWTCDLSHGYVDINAHYRT